MLGSRVRAPEGVRSENRKVLAFSFFQGKRCLRNRRNQPLRPCASEKPHPVRLSRFSGHRMRRTVYPQRISAPGCPAPDQSASTVALEAATFDDIRTNRRKRRERHATAASPAASAPAPNARSVAAHRTIPSLRDRTEIPRGSPRGKTPGREKRIDRTEASSDRTAPTPPPVRRSEAGRIEFRRRSDGMKRRGAPASRPSVPAPGNEKREADERPLLSSEVTDIALASGHGLKRLEPDRIRTPDKRPRSGKRTAPRSHYISK